MEPPEHPAIAKRSVSSQSATKRRACQAPARHTGRRAALEAELRDLPVREVIAAASGLRLALHVCLPRADHVARLLERRLLAPATGSSEGA